MTVAPVPKVELLVRPGSSHDSSPGVWDQVRSSYMTVETGEPLFVQGEPAASVMFVDEGLVRLTVLGD